MPKIKYDSINKYAAAHLLDCLKLQNNTACLNDNISKVGRRHLHPIMLPSHLKKAKLAIGKEELYPDILEDENSEKRVYIAVQIAMHQHSLQKQDPKKKKDKVEQLPHQEKERIPSSKLVSRKPYTPHVPHFRCSPPQDQNQDVTTHATVKGSKARRLLDTRRSSSIPMCDRDEDQAPINITMHALDNVSARRKAEMPFSERMTSNLASAAITPFTPSFFTSPSLRAHASHPLGSVSSTFSQPTRRVLFVPHVARSQPRSTINDPCSKHSSVSTIPATSNLSTSKDSPMHGSQLSQSDQNRSVHHFLEASVPSMSYLLPRFIDYGCTHEGFLLAVSMWPPERIKKFLEDVVAGPDSQSISPMEKMVLENHFHQYLKLDA